jgi:hypothetical protein
VLDYEKFVSSLIESLQVFGDFYHGGTEKRGGHRAKTDLLCASSFLCASVIEIKLK